MKTWSDQPEHRIIMDGYSILESMGFQKSSISVNHPNKESRALASDQKYRERRCYPKTVTGRILGALVFSLILSGQAEAYHKTNKFERQAAHANSDGGGWTVIYGKEFTHNDYLALGAALAADIYGGYGSATSAYLKQYADQTRQQILSEITRRAPQLLPTLSNELRKLLITRQIHATMAL